jgi:hypothetical protein
LQHLFLPIFNDVDGILDVLDCYFIGVDLDKASKTGLRRQLPYDLYELKTERNKLYWSYFNINSIMRPVCFVPTIDTIPQFIDWCQNINQPFRYNTANIRFWCFPYNYCDRSNWNEVSEESTFFFNIDDAESELIREQVGEEGGVSSEEEDRNSCSTLYDSDVETVA